MKHTFAAKSTASLQHYSLFLPTLPLCCRCAAAAVVAHCGLLYLSHARASPTSLSVFLAQSVPFRRTHSSAAPSCSHRLLPVETYKILPFSCGRVFLVAALTKFDCTFFSSHIYIGERKQSPSLSLSHRPILWSLSHICFVDVFTSFFFFFLSRCVLVVAVVVCVGRTTRISIFALIIFLSKHNIDKLFVVYVDVFVFHISWPRRACITLSRIQQPSISFSFLSEHISH